MEQTHPDLVLGEEKKVRMHINQHANGLWKCIGVCVYAVVVCFL